MASKASSLLEAMSTFSAGRSELTGRQLGCLVGACVADAAARPLHWVYNMDDLKRYLSAKPGGEDEARPEFYRTSKSPFYSLPTGENSCYFDLAHSVLKRIGSGYDYTCICDGFVEDFGPGSKFGYDIAKRQEYMRLRSQGRTPDPVEGKWMHGAIVKFLENYKSGRAPPYGDPGIKETDGLCAALPVIVKWAGHRELSGMTDQVVRTLTNWRTSVEHSMAAARIMEKFLLGHAEPISETKVELVDTMPDVVKNIEAVEATAQMDHVAAVGTIFGRPCYNPGSLQGALHAILTSGTYAEAVRKTIRAGGCNCSRAFFIGACLGARFGVAGIPQDWIEKTSGVELVVEEAMAALASKQASSG